MRRKIMKTILRGSFRKVLWLFCVLALSGQASGQSPEQIRACTAFAATLSHVTYEYKASQRDRFNYVMFCGAEERDLQRHLDTGGSASLSLPIKVGWLPIDANGHLKASEIQSWREKHCKVELLREYLQDIALKYEKRYTPESLATVGSCMNAKGFYCEINSVTDSQVVLDAWWFPYPGIANAPSMMEVRLNGTAFQKYEVRVGRNPIVLARTPSQDMTISVLPDRGDACVSTFPARVPLTLSVQVKREYIMWQLIDRGEVRGYAPGVACAPVPKEDCGLDRVKYPLQRGGRNLDLSAPDLNLWCANDGEKVAPREQLRMFWANPYDRETGGPIFLEPEWRHSADQRCVTASVWVRPSPKGTTACHNFANSCPLVGYSKAVLVPTRATLESIHSIDITTDGGQAKIALPQPPSREGLLTAWSVSSLKGTRQDLAITNTRPENGPLQGELQEDVLSIRYVPLGYPRRN
jgi:hypothetical protein